MIKINVMSIFIAFNALISTCIGFPEIRSVSYQLTVTGGALIDNLTVSNSTQLDSLIVHNNSSVDGSLDITGNFAVNTDKFSTNASTGDTIIAGNLDVAGTSTINNSLVVVGSVTADDVIVSNYISADSLAITTFMTVGENFNVDGMASFSAAQASDSISVGTILTVGGDTTLQGGLDVTNATTFNNDISVIGTTNLNTVNVENNAVINGTLEINGDTTFNGNVYLNTPTRLPLLDQSTTGAGPSSIAFSPQGSFVAVIDSEANKSLKIYSVTTGIISETPTSFTNVGLPSVVTWAPCWDSMTGGFVAVVNTNTLMIFSVSTLGNVSTDPVSTYLFNAPIFINWSPNWSISTGGFIAITVSNVIHVFSIDPDGILTEINSFTATNDFAAIDWSPNWSETTGGYIAVINTDSDELEIFSIDVYGEIGSRVSSQPIVCSASLVSFSPTGDYISVASLPCNTVQIFGIDSAGTLSSATSIQTLGFSPNTLAWSSHWSGTTGGFIAISSPSCNMVDIFSVDTDGQMSLSKTGYAYTGGYPSVTWAPNIGIIATANYRSNTIQTFDVSL